MDDPSTEMGASRSVGNTASSHIPFIRSSLKFHIDGLLELFLKMDSFTGLTDAEKSELRANLWKSYGTANANLQTGDLENFIERQFQSLSGIHFSFMRKFYTPFMNHAVPTILLSSALAEALINAIVATGLIMRNKSRFFAIFDRMELREKWCLGPSLFDDSIKVDLGNHHFETLKRLVQLRNAFVHSKIDISTTDGKDRIKGTSHHGINNDSDGRRSLFAFGELPDLLFDLIVASIPDQSMRFHIESTSFRFSV